MNIFKNTKRVLILAFLLTLACLSLSNAQSLTIAITPLQSSGISRTEAATLTNRLNVELVQIGKYAVMEQAKVINLLRQRGFEEAEVYATIENFIEVGKLLEVDYIISGSVGSIGQTFTLNLLRIAVDSGKIVQTIIHDVEGRIDEMLDLLRLAAMELSGIAPKKGQLIDIRKITFRQLKDQNIHNVKYHFGGSFFYAATRIDDYIPLGLRFLYHKNRYSLGAYWGKVVDYGYDHIEMRNASASLLFHKMTFAELSFDYHLSSSKPVSAFVGMAIAYSNPERSDWSRAKEPPWDSIYDKERKNKIGIHPQIGCYLRRDYAISSRIAFGLAMFPSEKEGLNNSGITFETSLLLSF